MNVQGCLLKLLIICLLQTTGVSGQDKTQGEVRQVLYINPVHLSKGNYTFIYERMLHSSGSLKVTLSGSEQNDFVAVTLDRNWYLGKDNTFRYFLGLSAGGIETPMETATP